jgi:serine/threonine protein kinase
MGLRAGFRPKRKADIISARLVYPPDAPSKTTFDEGGRRIVTLIVRYLRSHSPVRSTAMRLVGQPQLGLRSPFDNWRDVDPKLIGRYEIQRRLGKGGMGSLYLARDPELDRLVAIKLLKDDYQDEEEFRTRFAREARALAKLRHPNIVIVYDFGEHEGRPFMAMEYIDGETLSKRLTRHPPLSTADGLDLVGHLCAGLMTAHAAGIIHRDIKPDNVMLDQHGVLKLLDFGVARHEHESTHQMTQPGMIIGTYNYMAPEQLLGQSVDKRSDIYAVGVVLYQVVTQEKVFPGSVDEALISHLDPELPRIVRRALERDPDLRYQGATELRDDLARVRRRLAKRGSRSAGDSVVDASNNSVPSRRESGNEVQAALVAEQLRLSRDAFQRGDHEEALQYAQRAAFVDVESRAAIELVNRARLSIGTKSVQRLLKEAILLLSQGRLPEALVHAEDAWSNVPDLPEADGLREDIRQVSAQIHAARERHERIELALERARTSFEQGRYETALRHLSAVLDLDPDRREARDLEQLTKVRLQELREHERARRDAAERLNYVRNLIDEGRLSEATEELKSVTVVTDTARQRTADLFAEISERQRQAAIEAILAQARAAVAAEQVERATSLLDTIPVANRPHEWQEIRTAALFTLARRRELLKKQKHLERAILSIGNLIAAGALVQARNELRETLEVGLDDERLDSLSRNLTELEAAAEAKRVQEARDREVSNRIEAAPRLLEPGDRAALDEFQSQLADLEQHDTRLDETLKSAVHDITASETVVVVREGSQGSARTVPLTKNEESLDPRPRNSVTKTGISSKNSSWLWQPASKSSARGLLFAFAAIALIGGVVWFQRSERPDAEGARTMQTQASEVMPAPSPPPTPVRDTAPEKTSPNEAPPAVPVATKREPERVVSREEEFNRGAAVAIRDALSKGDIETAETLIRNAEREFGAGALRTQAETLARMRTDRENQQLQRRVQELVDSARTQQDHSAAIEILNRALQMAPEDPLVSAELRRRREALVAQVREKEAANQRQRDAQEIEQGLASSQATIDRALERGDVDGAESLLQDAERRYGNEAFASRRQRLAAERVKAVNAEGDRIRSQVRAALNQFAQAYSTRNEAALAAVWPSYPVSFRSTFKTFESLLWIFGTCEIDVQGAVATASCPATIRRVDIRGKDTSESVRRRFVLRNQSGTWRIESMQVQ